MLFWHFRLTHFNSRSDLLVRCMATPTLRFAVGRDAACMIIVHNDAAKSYVRRGFCDDTVIVCVRPPTNRSTFIRAFANQSACVSLSQSHVLKRCRGVITRDGKFVSTTREKILPPAAEVSATFPEGPRFQQSASVKVANCDFSETQASERYCVS